MHALVQNTTQKCTALLGSWGKEKPHITYLSVRIVFHRFGLHLLQKFTGFVPNRIVVFGYIEG